MEEIKQLAIEAFGFDRLNDMQTKMLEEASSGSNVLLLSPTGSGKTIAFVLPLINQLSEENSALIIVPSRELAIQISDVISKLKCGIHLICSYGGHDIKKETNKFSSISNKEKTIIVGTCGRIKDHIERGNIITNNINYLVLDEYDKSLELGFDEELKAIVSNLKFLNNTILTSATHYMPIAKWLNFTNYKKLDFLPIVKDNDERKYTQNTNLSLYQVKSPINDKLDTLKQLLCSFSDDSQIIVFSNYRESSERISHYLTDNGIENALYHGGLEQVYREKALARFYGNSIRVLVSTDLASRGLDIPDVSHIIHYHLPVNEEAFTHRNGRTARAGSFGSAYLLLGPNEFLPTYITKEPMYYRLDKDGKFSPSPFVTVYIGKGKKEKISKGDIVGFFTKNGNIEGSNIGRIDVYEHCAYCSIKRDIAANVIEKVKGLKIKGEKTHYLIVSGS